MGMKDEKARPWEMKRKCGGDSRSKTEKYDWKSTRRQKMRVPDSNGKVDGGGGARRRRLWREIGKMRTVTEQRRVNGTTCGVLNIARRVSGIFSSADVWTWALRANRKRNDEKDEKEIRRLMHQTDETWYSGEGERE